ncbi:Centriolar coiled-coil protein of [Trichinella spiralis]|uniref:Centriolar coiled-coil protein of n=1 Tax=Trichinella spiralis TaxID=6334 RepID=A0ABR3K3B1_TRISP
MPFMTYKLINDKQTTKSTNHNSKAEDVPNLLCQPIILKTEDIRKQVENLKLLRYTIKVHHESELRQLNEKHDQEQQSAEKYIHKLLESVENIQKIRKLQTLETNSPPTVGKRMRLEKVEVISVKSGKEKNFERAQQNAKYNMKLTALVKGYFTRRLFRTDEVKTLRMMFNHLHTQLDSMNDNNKLSPIEQHYKQLVVLQIKFILTTINRIFFTLSTKEKLKLISRSGNSKNTAQLMQWTDAYSRCNGCVEEQKSSNVHLMTKKRIN